MCKPLISELKGIVHEGIDIERLSAAMPLEFLDTMADLSNTILSRLDVILGNRNATQYLVDVVGPGVWGKLANHDLAQDRPSSTQISTASIVLPAARAGNIRIRVCEFDIADEPRPFAALRRDEDSPVVGGVLVLLSRGGIVGEALSEVNADEDSVFVAHVSFSDYSAS